MSDYSSGAELPTSVEDEKAIIRWGDYYYRLLTLDSKPAAVEGFWTIRIADELDCFARLMVRFQPIFDSPALAPLARRATQMQRASSQSKTRSTRSQTHVKSTSLTTAQHSTNEELWRFSVFLLLRSQSKQKLQTETSRAQSVAQEGNVSLCVLYLSAKQFLQVLSSLFGDGNFEDDPTTNNDYLTNTRGLASAITVTHPDNL